ncbi:uncharacterized protein LOC116023420 [Ipomoea triloba]|uniref:uncharacterized protein LOC116023420 n=1 Tax=Ipomoea triloba TaxID=35885 RepID=UPI00125E86FB|nr:uncharacterized protein LOC116023420 [Ipomoea triloba]
MQFSPFSTQSENDVTIIPPPTNTGSSRRTLWSIEDDKMLAHSYYTISQDSKIGNEQSGPRFWKRVEEYCNANVGNDRPKRNVDRLKSHWTLVKRLTYDFHTIYYRLQGMRPSDANDADIIVRATEEYKVKHGRDKFGYEHVWAICKDVPSWQPSFVARQASLSKSSTNQISSASVGGSVEGSGGGSSQGNEGGSEEIFP